MIMSLGMFKHVSFGKLLTAAMQNGRRRRTSDERVDERLRRF